MNHADLDQVSLRLAQRVAERLREQPGIMDVARQNLDRWRRLNANSPSLLRCYEEWQRILARPVDEVCAVLCAETDEGQRLRQNSPFAGVLSPAEVWKIKAHARHATTPA